MMLGIHVYEDRGGGGDLQQVFVCPTDHQHVIAKTPNMLKLETWDYSFECNMI